MPRREWVWMRVKALTPEEKADIAAACNRLIAEVLKPRYLGEVRPTQFNYPIDLHGKWRGSKFSFLTRFRSGFPDNAGEDSTRPSRVSTISRSVLTTSGLTSCGAATQDNIGPSGALSPWPKP